MYKYEYKIQNIKLCQSTILEITQKGFCSTVPKCLGEKPGLKGFFKDEQVGVYYIMGRNYSRK